MFLFVFSYFLQVLFGSRRLCGGGGGERWGRDLGEGGKKENCCGRKKIMGIKENCIKTKKKNNNNNNNKPLWSNRNLGLGLRLRLRLIGLSPKNKK